MEILILLGALAGVSLIAFLLGLRDENNARKALIARLKKNYGQAPDKVYKADDLDHVTGYYNHHSDEYQLDDTTWNDLNMDGVYKRLNYCLSATGEEYLYYMLRTPRQKDDFDELENKVSFFEENNDARISCQSVFARIGRGLRYSIYDYLELLDDEGNFSNSLHYIMLALITASVGLCFYKFAIGFVILILLMFTNIFMYFRINSSVEPYLASYRYILRVIDSTRYFSSVDYPEIQDEINELTRASKSLEKFSKGSYILMSPTRMNSAGNPADLLLDYIRMVTHADIIKFNHMYKQIMAKRDDLDAIITTIGKLEVYVSIACFRASFEGRHSKPVFESDYYDALDLIHPLIQEPVANSVDTGKGLLITGSNASGKSTFLKTCAINTVLAQTIHTVLASKYKAPMFRVYSSMALQDNLFEGDSYYIVEIKSMKRILDAGAAPGNPVLCFVDEVLRGTNTIERIAASAQILKTFRNNNVICFAATHDIELTQMLSEDYDIYHFEGNVTDNDVRFDYKLKSGPATNRNAIKLLGVLGYDNNIVDNAQRIADRFIETGSWI